MTRTPSLTRAAFELIAQTLRDDAAHLSMADFDYESADHWQRGAYDQWSTTVLAFGRALRATNGQFDADRFYSAAGFKGGAK